MSSTVKKCTVCHVISGDLWAGAEVMANHLIHALSLSDAYNVIAIVLNKGRLVEELKKNGIEVIVIEESVCSFPVIFFKAYKTLRKRNVNILHSHRRKENLLALVLSIVLRCQKTVTTLHGMPEIFKESFSVNQFLARLDFIILSRFFSCVVVVSDEIRDLLISKHKFSRNKTIAIHNGIPCEISFCKQKGRGQKFVIGTAGRFVPVKNFDLFIAIARLFQNNHMVQFVIAGDGPLFQELKHQAECLMLTNIKFLGNVENMNSFYSQIDLFVNTSIHEGIPMTILEAMSKGIPVIAPNIGGIPEIIEDGINGFLIQQREPHLFAEKCDKLLTDHSIYEKISNESKNRIKDKFSLDVMAELYFKVYLGLNS